MTTTTQRPSFALRRARASMPYSVRVQLDEMRRAGQIDANGKPVPVVAKQETPKP